MMNYQTHINNDSLYNTPPTFSIYVAMLTCRWLKELGGVKEIIELNKRKANLLYETIDVSELFSSPVEKEFRSLTNIPFGTTNKELDSIFIQEALEEGFLHLKGHRSVGGMRASIYNAFPLEGVEEFVAFIKRFEKERNVQND